MRARTPPGLPRGDGLSSQVKFVSEGSGRGRGEQAASTRGPVSARQPARGGAARRREPGRPLRGGGEVGRSGAGPARADSLGAALAHGPLRNRPRRGFPGGVVPCDHYTLPAPASQNGGSRGGGRRLGPILWAARDLSPCSPRGRGQACARAAAASGATLPRPAFPGRRRRCPAHPRTRSGLPAARRGRRRSAGLAGGPRTPRLGRGTGHRAAAAPERGPRRCLVCSLVLNKSNIRLSEQRRPISELKKQERP